MVKHEPVFRIVGTATVGPKGQVVIPAEVRESMGIKTGDKLLALHVCPKNIIAFITEDQAQVMVDKLGDKVIGFQNTPK
ncbi:MAG: AbrB/MazE/SpoVT family DNA-binding domain-containing protein [Microcoleus sp.]